MSKRPTRTPPATGPAAAAAEPEAPRGQGGELQRQSGEGRPTLSTKDGMPLADNQNTLRTAPRGASELADPVFLDKLSHFGRERIPERVVHARGAAAHGRFVLTHSLKEYTTSQVLTEVGQEVPVFVRLSTVAGPAGSADTVRDVRGFAVKFYTSQGNWDLVGNNIPVFFIQDAIKFPDIVHAVKREPDRGFPTASSAHDTFWDFISLMPESLHMLMWLMSDRSLPRSLTMMEGFGVHTFKLLDAQGQATLVKYHWRPVLGLQSLVWDEAVKIAGADPDFHRRELFEMIHEGLHPAWDLAVQLFTEDEAEGFPFDVLDATKLIPEELVPLQVIGRMTLDRNPTNFFAENEQVAFCPSRIVPGMDFSNDPLLQGRVQSYTDTQVHRLGGPNFQQLPINRPQCPVHHFQRDGAQQHELPSGRVAYEPNSLALDSAAASASAGQRSHATRPAEGTRGRSRPPSFADHHSQARMFYRSQSAIEQAHIAAALSFELSKVETPQVRERVVAQLRVIDEALARSVADGLAMAPLPPAAVPAQAPQTLPASAALGILAKANPTLRARCVGLLFDEASDAEGLAALVAALKKAGARVKLIAPRIGGATLSNGKKQAADGHLAAAPSVLFDAVALILSPDAAARLATRAEALDFVAQAHAHLKAIGFDEGAHALIKAAGVSIDEGVVPLSARKAYLAAAATRHWARDALLRPPA